MDIPSIHPLAAAGLAILLWEALHQWGEHRRYRLESMEAQAVKRAEFKRRLADARCCDRQFEPYTPCLQADCPWRLPRPTADSMMAASARARNPQPFAYPAPVTTPDACVTASRMNQLPVGSHGNPIELVPVESSNMESVGYDSETETLYVKFRNGRMWLYHGVPAAKHESLMGAASVGTYFAQVIKLNYVGEAME